MADGPVTRKPSSTATARSAAGHDAESGRGLMLVSALSKEWSYFCLPGGGKVVYCYLETA